VDLSGALSLDGTFRYVSDIVNQQVPEYGELDLRLGWKPAPRLELSVVGQNLLHDHHVEFGTPGAHSEIKRGAYGSFEWHF
jgi:iron complex outermembrane receptor protein